MTNIRYEYIYKKLQPLSGPPCATAPFSGSVRPRRTMWLRLEFFCKWVKNRAEKEWKYLLRISFSGIGRLARWGPMCPGLSGLPALFQLYIFWTWKPNEVSSTSTLPKHGAVMIDDGREPRKCLFSRFICLLLSSCEDITTDCDDCHAGVPQCQVGG